MNEFLDAFTQHWGWAWLVVGALAGLFVKVAFAVLEDL